MLNDLFMTVQAELNKNGFGYLKPMYFNLFTNRAIRKIYNSAFPTYKSNIRKQNWMLDGKNFANLSELQKQLIEYYSKYPPLLPPYNVPDDMEYAIDIFVGDKRAEKVDFSDLLDAERNIYCSPNKCAYMCSLLDNKFEIRPTPPTKYVKLHYIRKPKKAKWTYVEMAGDYMFNETAQDFQDIDMPESYFDDLASSVVEQASIMLRELNVAQLENQEQTKEVQQDNIQ